MDFGESERVVKVVAFSRGIEEGGPLSERLLLEGGAHYIGLLEEGGPRVRKAWFSHG